MHTLKGYNTDLKSEEDYEDYSNALAEEGGNIDKFMGFAHMQLQF
jgi:hypothetical protein